MIALSMWRHCQVRQADALPYRCHSLVCLLLLPGSVTRRVGRWPLIEHIGLQLQHLWHLHCGGMPVGLQQLCIGCAVAQLLCMRAQ